MKVRAGGRIVSTAVISAVAVNTDGRREVLGLATGPSEAEPFWTTFLRARLDRGRRGVKLVVADNHKGRRAAADRVLPATVQRGKLHVARNLLAHGGPSQRAMVAAMLKTIFAQESVEAAHRQRRQVADTPRPRFAKLAELMDGAADDGLAHRTFPKEHRPQLASTNPLERVNGEIKRRTHLVGILPKAEAIVRLVGAPLLEQPDEGAVSRRDMTLETLAETDDTAPISRPARPARSTSARTEHRSSKHHAQGHDSVARRS